MDPVRSGSKYASTCTFWKRYYIFFDIVMPCRSDKNIKTISDKNIKTISDKNITKTDYPFRNEDISQFES